MEVGESTDRFRPCLERALIEVLRACSAIARERISFPAGGSQRRRSWACQAKTVPVLVGRGARCGSEEEGVGGGCRHGGSGQVSRRVLRGRAWASTLGSASVCLAVRAATVTMPPSPTPDVRRGSDRPGEADWANLAARTPCNGRRADASTTARSEPPNLPFYPADDGSRQARRPCISGQEQLSWRNSPTQFDSPRSANGSAAEICRSADLEGSHKVTHIGIAIWEVDTHSYTYV